MFSFLSALTGVGIPLIQKSSSAFHFLEMRIKHLMSSQKLSGGWCPVSLQGRKIHSPLNSALIWCLQNRAWSAAESISGRQNLRLFHLFVSLITRSSLGIRPSGLLKGVFTSMLAKQIQIQVLIYPFWGFELKE